MLLPSASDPTISAYFSRPFNAAWSFFSFLFPFISQFWNTGLITVQTSLVPTPFAKVNKGQQCWPLCLSLFMFPPSPRNDSCLCNSKWYTTFIPRNDSCLWNSKLYTTFINQLKSLLFHIASIIFWTERNFISSVADKKLKIKTCRD